MKIISTMVGKYTIKVAKRMMRGKYATLVGGLPLELLRI